jgi:hypothetical protein
MVNMLIVYNIITVSVTKSVLVGRFAIIKEVTAKTKRALTEALKMVSKNASKSFMNTGKSVSLTKGATL